MQGGVVRLKAMSLAGESSSALASDRGSLAAGVRGLSGAITMERSEHEKLKYPDRINLDRKGLHGRHIRIVSRFAHYNLDPSLCTHFHLPFVFYFYSRSNSC